MSKQIIYVILPQKIKWLFCKDVSHERNRVQVTHFVNKMW